MARTFVDTNVLVYAHDRSEGSKREIARGLLADLWERRDGCLSTQVLQETYVVVTRKLRRPMARPEARRLVAAYGEWPLVRTDVPMIVAASEIEARHRLSFWDAMIVEAARRLGAVELLSEDLQDGRRIGGVVIRNPFRPYTGGVTA